MRCDEVMTPHTSTTLVDILVFSEIPILFLYRSTSPSFYTHTYTHFLFSFLLPPIIIQIPHIPQCNHPHNTHTEHFSDLSNPNPPILKNPIHYKKCTTQLIKNTTAKNPFLAVTFHGAVLFPTRPGAPKTRNPFQSNPFQSNPFLLTQIPPNHLV